MEAELIINKNTVAAIVLQRYIQHRDPHTALQTLQCMHFEMVQIHHDKHLKSFDNGQ